MSQKQDGHEVPARRLGALAVALALALLAAVPASTASAQPAPSGTDVSPEVAEQMAAVADEKAERTPTEQKLDSNLLYAVREDASQPAVEGAPGITSSVETTGGAVLVDIDGRVNPQLTASIESAGGGVIAAVPGFDAIRAELPVGAVVELAERSDVTAIRPADEATTNRSGSSGIGANEADVTHAADRARSLHGVDGTGVKVCVLSDGVASLAERQATGDLPPVDVLPGQAGPASGDEGTAMLELIHDVAPGAELGFATAFTSQASFAQNILNLRTDGCKVMVDDVTWYSETTLQDANIAQAISTVRAAGVTYFSSAGNSGNLPDGTSGTWQGDFQDGGAASAPLPTTATVHRWGPGGATSNALTKVDGPLNLQWADPVGGSANDYDLYVLNSAGTAVVASSTNVQNGTQNPAESIDTTLAVGDRVVVTKKAAAADRYLVLYTNGGTLATGTGGAARGHNVSEAAVSVAATPAGTALGAGHPAGPHPGTFSSSSVSEKYSSDGPTRQYFTPAGVALTPGDFSSTGGVGRNGVDLTAADGVTTTTPGFIPFYGTSAAAPNAAALAALALDDQPALTPAQVEAAMAASAIDIEAAGVDTVTGPGIVMAPALLAAVGSTIKANLTAGTRTVTPLTGDADAYPEPGETASITQPLTNVGGASAAGVTATLVSNSANATVTQGSTTYGTIAAGDTASPTGAPLAFSVAPGCPCGTALPFTLTVSFSGGAAPSVSMPISVPVGAPAATVSTAYSGAVVPIPDLSATGASATVDVTGTSLIQDLTLTIGGTSCTTAAGAGIDHSYVNDLTLTLTSPQGTVVTLMSRTGGSGDNLCQTVFSDSAAASIQEQGAPEAPFTGSFRPATPLSAFDQESPQGTWTLKAVDAAGTDTGSIRAFSIQIAGADCTIANTAPAGVGDEYRAVQDQTRTVAAPGVLANDTDAEDDDLTAELVSGPAHGTVTLNADGSFAYVPAAGYSGSDSFTYRPDDGTADGSTATVSLTVDPRATLPTRAYVAAVYDDFLGRAGDPGGAAYWAGRLDRGVETRPSFVRKMSRSHEFSVKIVTRSFHDVLGRNPDPSGRGFWANRVQKGMPVGTLALNLIASNEYLTKTGGTVDGFVSSTFNAIFGRAPSATERSARVNQISGGTSRLAVASELYASIESRRRRTRAQFQLLLGRPPTSGEVRAWIANLATKSDVDLAIFLGASDEYYAAAQPA